MNTLQPPSQTAYTAGENAVTDLHVATYPPEDLVEFGYVCSAGTTERGADRYNSDIVAAVGNLVANDPNGDLRIILGPHPIYPQGLGVWWRAKLVES